MCVEFHGRTDSRRARGASSSVTCVTLTAVTAGASRRAERIHANNQIKGFRASLASLARCGEPRQNEPPRRHQSLQKYAETGQL
jgi:hypothetical protein